VSDSARRGIEGERSYLRISSGPSIRRFLDRIGIFGTQGDAANEVYERLVAAKVAAKESFCSPFDPDTVQSVTVTEHVPTHGIRISAPWLIANGLIVRAPVA